MEQSEQKYRCNFTKEEWVEVCNRKTPDLRLCLRILYTFLTLEWFNPEEPKFYTAEDVYTYLNHLLPGEFTIKMIQAYILTIAVSYGSIFIIRTNPQTGEESYKLHSFYDKYSKETYPGRNPWEKE